MTVRNILYADEGKILTDGKAYGTEIFLEVGRTADEFYEITEEEYDEVMKKLSEENENV